jgi:uncharacterized protein YbjQ (UPF0145 family)
MDLKPDALIGLQMEKPRNKVIVCTTETVPGRQVASYRGVVWASSARTKNVFADVWAVLLSLGGGELKVYKRLGNEARETALRELAESAARQGADAVIGVRLGSTQLLPSTVEVFAYGTAVTLKK